LLVCALVFLVLNILLTLVVSGSRAI
jgi:hypothetical protein